MKHSRPTSTMGTEDVPRLVAVSPSGRVRRIGRASSVSEDKVALDLEEAGAGDGATPALGDSWCGPTAMALAALAVAS